MAQAWKSWEMLLHVEVLVDTLMWESLVLSLVGLHLGNEVHEVLWLLEELQLLGVDKIAKLVLNLDNQLNHVKLIESVVAEVAIEGNAGLLGGSEVVLEDAQHILFNLVVGLEHKGVLLLSLKVLPHGNLIGGLVFSWHKVGSGVKAEMALETSGLEAHKGSAVVGIAASAEADVVSWLHHLL